MEINDDIFTETCLSLDLALVTFWVHKNYKELSVEFNLAMHMLVLLNWLLLLYVQLNHRKIMVIRISFLVAPVKIWAPETL